MVGDDVSLDCDVRFIAMRSLDLLQLGEITRGDLDHFSVLESFEGGLGVGIEGLSPIDFNPGFREKLVTVELGVVEDADGVFFEDGWGIRTDRNPLLVDGVTHHDWTAIPTIWEASELFSES